MDLDKPCLCPECNDVEKIEYHDVDWDSNMCDDELHWWCDTCEDHHFPEDNEDASSDKPSVPAAEEPSS